MLALNTINNYTIKCKMKQKQNGGLVDVLAPGGSIANYNLRM